jgi:small conductance mechanosensitive channel
MATFAGVEWDISRIVLTLVILFNTWLIAKFFKIILQRGFEKSSRHLKVDVTQFSFLKHVVTAVIWVIGLSIVIYTIPALRNLSTSLLASAGILAVIIGFASQQAFSNIVSGILIVIFKPFRVGDRLSIGTDVRGVVEDITLRHTVIRNYENKRLIIPNSVISNETIENADIGDQKVCKWVEFGISYDSDIDKAMKIMREEAMKHPDFLDARTEKEKKEKQPAVNVRVLGFGDSSVNLRAWVWANDAAAAFRLGTDLNKTIKERFDREGIEIPFPYRTVVFKDKKRSRKVRKR